MQAHYQLLLYTMRSNCHSVSRRLRGRRPHIDQHLIGAIDVQYADANNIVHPRVRAIAVCLELSAEHYFSILNRGSVGLDVDDRAVIRL